MDGVICSINSLYNGNSSKNEILAANETIIKALYNPTSCMHNGFSLLQLSFQPDCNCKEILSFAGSQFLLTFVNQHWNQIDVEQKKIFMTEATKCLNSVNLLKCKSTMRNFARLNAEIAVREYPQNWASMLYDLNTLITSGIVSGLFLADILCIIGDYLMDDQKLSKQRKSDLIAGLEPKLPDIFNFLLRLLSEYASNGCTWSDSITNSIKLMFPLYKSVHGEESFRSWVNSFCLLYAQLMTVNDIERSLSVSECYLSVVECINGRRTAISERAVVYSHFIQSEVYGYLFDIFNQLTALSLEGDIDANYLQISLCNYFTTLLQTFLCDENKAQNNPPAPYLMLILQVLKHRNYCVNGVAVKYLYQILKSADPVSVFDKIQVEYKGALHVIIYDGLRLLLHPNLSNQHDQRSKLLLINFDDEEQARLFLATHRVMVLNLLQQVNSVESSLFLQAVDSWFSEVQSKFSFDCSEELIQMLNSLASCIDQTKAALTIGHFQQAVGFLKKSVHNVDLCIAALALLRSTLFVAQQSAPDLLSAVELVVQLIESLQVDHVAIGDREAMSLRSVCCRFILKVCEQCAPCLVQIYDAFRTVIWTLLSRNLNQVEVYVLCEALIVLSKSSTADHQCQLIDDILSRSLPALLDDRYYSVREPLTCFLRAVGITSNPHDIECRKALIYGVVATQSVVRYSDINALHVAVQAHSGFRFRQLIDRLLEFCSVFNLLSLDSTVSSVPDNMKPALQQLAFQGAQLQEQAGVGKSNAAHVRNFLQNFVSGCYITLGCLIERLPFLLVDVGGAVLEKLIRPVCGLPYAWSKLLLQHVLKILLTSDALPYRAEVLGELSVAFQQRLLSQWEDLSARLSGEVRGCDDAEEADGSSEVSEDRSLASFSTEYLQTVKAALVVSGQDEARLSELGGAVLQGLPRFEALFTTLLAALSWKDSACSACAAAVLLPLVKALADSAYAQNHLLLASLVRAALNGLRVNGADAAALALYDLAFDVYITFALPGAASLRPLFVDALRAPERLAAFDKNLVRQNNQVTRTRAAAKKFREIFKSLVEQDVASRFRFDKVHDLTPIERMKKVQNADLLSRAAVDGADAGQVGLCTLFGS